MVTAYSLSEVIDNRSQSYKRILRKRKKVEKETIWKTGKKPDQFKLVNLKIGERVVPGWWTGQTWDSGISIDTSRVEAWSIRDEKHVLKD